jgi:hypothetical protein
MSFIPKDNPLPIKKIYVDSMKRINRDMTSSTDFTIELPLSLTFPEYSTAYVSELSIPFSWRTIDANVNDKLYMRMCVTESVSLAVERTGQALIGTLQIFKPVMPVVRVVDSVITLTSSTYSGQSLATEIASQINKVYLTIPDSERGPLVLNKDGTPVLKDGKPIKDLIESKYLKVTFDETTNRLVFGVDNQMTTAGSLLQLRFFTDRDMMKMKTNTDIFKNRVLIDPNVYNDFSVFGAYFNPDDLQSANEAIGNKSTSKICGVDFANTLPLSTNIYCDWTTGFLNLLRYTDLYLCSEDLTSFRTIGPNGESSIIKKIPVTASFGGVIVSETVLPGDYIELGNKTVRQLHFRLIGNDGRVVNLNGGNLSFSLVFNKT